MGKGIFKEFDALVENMVEQKDGKSIKENMDAICESIQHAIEEQDTFDEKKKKKLLKKLERFCNAQTNIMLVGATGCGKSSTINALFSCGGETAEVAKVGTKADPETKDIEKYTIGNLVLWDTPGLGDGTEIDEHHKNVIRDLLQEKDDEGNALIDLVLVILDGSTRDLGTSYKILNEVIIPELEDETGRILLALNQADVAMKTGRHWDYEKNEPDETLIAFLEDKLKSIKERIKTDSGLDVEPIYYCAGYKEESGDEVHPYNLSKLLYYILNAIPSRKRVAVMEGVSMKSKLFSFHDGDKDYGEEIYDSFMGSFDDFFSEGLGKGVEIGGMILGVPGAIVGGVIGGAIGCIQGLFKSIF